MDFESSKTKNVYNSKLRIKRFIFARINYTSTKTTNHCVTSIATLVSQSRHSKKIRTPHCIDSTLPSIDPQTQTIRTLSPWSKIIAVLIDTTPAIPQSLSKSWTPGRLVLFFFHHVEAIENVPIVKSWATSLLIHEFRRIMILTSSSSSLTTPRRIYVYTGDFSEGEAETSF